VLKTTNLLSAVVPTKFVHERISISHCLHKITYCLPSLMPLYVARIFWTAVQKFTSLQIRRSRTHTHTHTHTPHTHTHTPQTHTHHTHITHTSHTHHTHITRTHTTHHTTLNKHTPLTQHTHTQHTHHTNTPHTHTHTIHNTHPHTTHYTPHIVLMSLVSVLNLLYFYISTFRSMCAVPNMAVFCSSLTSCFPGMLHHLLVFSK